VDDVNTSQSGSQSVSLKTDISRAETVKKILTSTEETWKVLRDLISKDEQQKLRMLEEEWKILMIVKFSELVRELLDQVKAGQFQIREALRSIMM
jgi:hypothetical protein